MKKIILFLCFIVSAMFFVSANNKADMKKIQKAQEKRIQEINDSLMHSVALEAINKMDFVLQVDRVSFKSGNPIYTESSTNFIIAHNGKATVQIAFPRGGLGANGMGGITVEGTVSNVKIKTDKKGNTTLSFSVMGSSISASIILNLINKSDQGYANVSPNFNSRDMSVYGRIIPYEESVFFKGTTR